MFTAYSRSRVQRRGVVLIVVLGMLGLLALVGVTFATFSGQAKVSARGFMLGQNRPDSSEMMDFALAQLIDDTGNKMSAIRGHSLKRDMYGNDAAFNGFLAVDPNSGASFTFSTVSNTPFAGGAPNDPRAGLYGCVSNILLSDPTYANYDFRRWIVRFPAQSPGGGSYFAATSYEIIIDDKGQYNAFGPNGLSTQNRVFFFAAISDPALPSPTVSGYYSVQGPTNQSTLISPMPVGTAFTLDGRYLHAFNGPGMEGLGAGMSRYANFRVNGNILAATGTDAPLYGNPNDPTTMCSMDEDYDACDLENWFMAVQSADGQVVIPSFHRPGILVYDPNANDPLGASPYDDWTSKSVFAASKILRPRAIDGHDANTFPNLYPGTTGKINYDVDNDGDGVTDSVWLDLGYPAKKSAGGKIVKPLFAFMIIGLNGKLPLNTAGNLQLRDGAGSPLFAHASHLGYSPSEIDLSFALQNAFGLGNQQYDNSGVNVSLTQNRNILAGARPQDAFGNNQDSNTVLVNGSLVPFPNGIFDATETSSNPYLYAGTPSIAGRWGEADSVPQYLPAPDPNFGATYNNPVRAGLSNISYYNQTYNNSLPAPMQFVGDAGDDNGNTFDQFPPNLSSGGLLLSESPASPLPADEYDAAGGLKSAVERIRRFVTPIDVAGDGLITTRNAINTSVPVDTSLGGRVYPYPIPYAALRGGSGRGHLNYYKYFRPPGVPVSTPISPATWPSGVVSSTWYPNGVTAPANLTVATPVIPDRTNNLFHGYESARNPTVPVGTLLPLMYGGMPYETGAYPPPSPPTPPTAAPTFNQNTSSYGLPLTTAPFRTNFLPHPTTTTGATNPYYAISPNLNEADEMSLYQATQWDQPYGPSDLEWLYRQQDVDGGSLQSRLSKLAPISFLNPVDGLRRRRLMTTDSWETTQFSWANDNPYGVFPNNSRFLPAVDPSMATIGRTTPSIAHGNRRINLNFPLPVSNSAIEPVRQKWIRETYQFLKAVLPPKSVDTPQELAQLSQFVVNIIDYRDPDSTCTKFVNTDLTVVPGTGGASPTPPSLTFTATAPALAYDPSLTESSTTYLVQWGMEFSPIAINEVLAYQFQTEMVSTTDQTVGAAANNIRRLWFELVNTLSADNSATPASSLDLAGWDYVIMPDTPLGRPDPFTGQIPKQAAPATDELGVTLMGAAENASISGTALSNPLTPRIGTNGTTAFYVFGNVGQTNAAGNPSEVAVSGNLPTPTITPASAQCNPITGTLLEPAATPTESFYWLYIRRPANPFDTSFDPNRPNDNRVVVDSFRFMFDKSSYTGYRDAMNKPQIATHGATDHLYSLERLQPYRGGHAVPPIPAVAGSPNYGIPAYGYSEQSKACVAGSTFQGQYAIDNSSGTPVPKYSTEVIHHTLGAANSVRDTSRDLVPFHDRDFASVAELLTVPGCPPGLFTKQFCEFVPPVNFGSAAVPLAMPPDDTVVPPATLTSAAPFLPASPPHTFPYLVDNFFYTGQSEDGLLPAPATGVYPTQTGTNAAPYVGGPGGAGWYKMLEFFEVPSTAFGATGTVAQGNNYDWYRKDTRPGQLNLNLIMDEEVFFGLMSESWLNLLGNPTVDSLGDTRLNVAQLAASNTPLVVTQIDSNGLPTTVGSYHMPNTGFAAADPLSAASYPNNIDNRMKAVFSDFLKLRHGGSGYMFAHGLGAVGFPVTSGGTTTGPIASERPFRSLSYPDINFTVMRPATLPPSKWTNPQVYPVPAASGTATWITWPSAAWPLVPFQDPMNATGTGLYFPVLDPGVKNPLMFMQNNPVQPEPIPPRRLFQLGDVYGTAAAFYTAGPEVPGALATYAAATPATVTATSTTYMWAKPPSNAAGSPFPLAGPPIVRPYAGDSNLSLFTQDANLTNPYADLAIYAATYQPGITGGLPPTTIPFPYLGCNQTGALNDNSQHPYFRTDWLQKVMNLTTVRTHQYAVWITVGFFEVTALGDPDPVVAATAPGLAYDRLGAEIGALEGRNVRFRSFFVIDRTKATGFSPQNPGNFRDCVVYRQLIE